MQWSSKGAFTVVRKKFLGTEGYRVRAGNNFLYQWILSTGKTSNLGHRRVLGDCLQKKNLFIRSVLILSKTSTITMSVARIVNGFLTSGNIKTIFESHDLSKFSCSYFTNTVQSWPINLVENNFNTWKTLRACAGNLVDTI